MTLLLNHHTPFTGRTGRPRTRSDGRGRPARPTIDSTLSSAAHFPTPIISSSHATDLLAPATMTLDVSNLGQTEWQDLDVKKLLLFSSLATVFENSIMWPMWAMKTRQQVQTGAVTQSLSIRRMGGIRSLYKGFLFYAVASLPAYLVYISTYTYAKSALGLHYNTSPADVLPAGTVPGPSFQQTMAPMFAGFIADAACLALYIPVEIVAQRLQLPTRYTGVQQVLTDMWREDGLRTFYRGFGATVVTSGIASGVWWQSYESLKSLFTVLAREHAPPPEPRPTPAPTSAVLSPFSSTERMLNQVADVLATVRQSLPHMAAGLFAGGLSALATNPFDVAKTRLQTQHVKPGPLTFVRSLKTILQTEGLRQSFLRGLAPKLVSSAPLGMLSSVMYEGILFLSRKDSSKLQESGSVSSEKAGEKEM